MYFFSNGEYGIFENVLKTVYKNLDFWEKY